MIMTNGSQITVLPDDLRLEKAALEACGYRVHLSERAGTQWLTACKGLQVRYTHWHPLTNITQAMQLLEQCCELSMTTNHAGATVVVLPKGQTFEGWGDGLIAAQCRAIVTACASLKAVR